MKKLVLALSLLCGGLSASANAYEWKSFHNIDFSTEEIYQAGTASSFWRGSYLVSVCRDLNKLVGSLNSYNSKCLVPWDSVAYSNNNFEILVIKKGDSLSWKIPELSYTTVRSNAGSHGNLPVCSPKNPVGDSSSVRVGYYVASHNKCYYPKGGRQYSAGPGEYLFLNY